MTAGISYARGISLLFVISLFTPFALHHVPSAGWLPAGAHLLPMFYAPLIGVVLYGFYPAVIAGLAAPILNHYVTGSPVLPAVGMVTAEMFIFICVVYFLHGRRYTGSLSAVIGYLMAQAIVHLSGKPWFIPLPGIIILLLMTIWLGKLKHDLS